MIWLCICLDSLPSQERKEKQLKIRFLLEQSHAFGISHGEETYFLFSALVNNCAASSTVWLVVNCMYSELMRVVALSFKNPTKHL